MSYLSSKKMQLAARQETTRGTYNAPTGSDIYDVFDLNYVDTDPQVKDLAILRNTHTRLPDAMVMGAIYGTVTFKMVAVIGSNSNVVEHVQAMRRFWESAALEASGEAPCYVRPADSAETSLSIVCTYDGRARRLRGCTGNMKLVLAPGEVPYWDCSFTGVYEGTSETPALSGTPYLATPSLYSVVGQFRINDGVRDMYSCVSKLELDPGVSVAPFVCLGASQGVKHFARNATAPKLSFSSRNFFSFAGEAYDQELDTAFKNGTRVTIDNAGVIQGEGKLEKLQLVDDSGWQTWEGVVDLRSSTAQGEFKILIGIIE